MFLTVLLIFAILLLGIGVFAAFKAFFNKVEKHENKA